MTRWTLAMLTILTACDQDVIFETPPDPCPPSFAEDDAGDCVFDEARVIELVATFDQGSMELVNTEPFGQITSPEVIRNVWITKLPVAWDLDTVELYGMIDPDEAAELPAVFPVGTVLLHERVDRTEGHTVQVKREEGWVGDDGELWWFGKYFEDGTPDENPCSPCVACHNEGVNPETEGLWGVPRDAL